MTRFEYQVLKPFSLQVDSEGKEEIITDNHSNLGPDFIKGSMYVDYKSEDGSVDMNKTTAVLEARKFIRLLSPT